MVALAARHHLLLARLFLLRNRLHPGRDKLKLAQASVRSMSETAIQTTASTSQTALTTALTMALKEWSVAVDAIAQGETILLLRKGGIKEEKGRFVAAAERVVLLPTFEHQKPELLKPQYQSAVQPVTSGWHPNALTLKAWAEITDIFLTDDAEKVEALSEFHIWQPNLAQARLKWKAKQPLYVLTLRAYRFKQPITLPWDEDYGGCRSWVTLKEHIATEESEAAIAHKDYKQQVDAIAQIISR